MTLTSVFNTAISGLNASETTIDVSGNNVANANTVGFKASNAIFATQFSQTLSLGSAPSEGAGGSDPEQTGLGVQVAAINEDFSQGTLQTTSNPSDLAIQGDGFFTLQSSNGQQLFTRDGQFQLNAQNQLTTVSGDFLLGYGVDSNYNIQATQLQPLTIPLGVTAVAKATTSVTMSGALPPSGDLSTTAEISQSQILGDAAFTAPAAGTTAALSDTPILVPGSATSQTAAGGLTSGDTYQYEAVFVNPINGTNPQTYSYSTPSQPISVTLGASDNQVTLSNLPNDSNYAGIMLYRTDGNGSTFKLVTQTPLAMGSTSYVDTTDDATLDTVGNPTVNTNTLNGDYSYYVTYSNVPPSLVSSQGTQSRPSPLIGPINVVNGAIQLSNIPTSSDPQWNGANGSICIYRNTATDPSDFQLLTALPNVAGQSYTDSTPDSGLYANTLNMNGPAATSSTLLTNVLTQGANGTAQDLFQLGTLNFTGDMNNGALATQTLKITATTTLQDLANFIQQATGIQTPPGSDPANPIPSDSSGLPPGVTINSQGQLQVVSNNGTDSAVTINPAAFQLTPTGGSAQQVNLDFNTTQQATGTGAVASVVAYDSLGNAVNVQVTTELQSQNSTETVYRWYATSPNNEPASGVGIAVGTGLITFNGQGQFVSATNDTVSVDRTQSPAVSPLSFQLNFGEVSGLAATTASLSATGQDGFPPGTLTSYNVDDNGVIVGSFSNGTQRNLGQVELTRFANPDGLVQNGQNTFAAGVNSGLPITTTPNSGGAGSIVAGALESSNTDVGQSLIELITASSDYQANAKVISAADQLLTNLLQLGPSG